MPALPGIALASLPPDNERPGAHMTPALDALIFDNATDHRKRLVIMTLLCFIAMC